MDEIDKAIVEHLINNARISYVELAKRLNLSEAAIRKRIKKLEKTVIFKYTIFINPKRSDFFVSFTGIDVEPGSLMEIIEKLKDFNEIKSIFLTSGDHNLLVEIISESLEKLKEVHKKISEIEGVKRVCPSMVIDILK